MNEVLFQKLQAGRRKYQAERTRKRLDHEKHLFDLGIEDIGALTGRELFLVGVSLYWAEGFKHRDESALGLATLDPKMANLYVHWLVESMRVEKGDLLFRITVNEACKDRVVEMEKYWADFLGVNSDQFRRPFFQKTKQIKTYSNSGNYHGVIRIRARKSLDLLRKMRGWMVGLAQARDE